MLVGGGDDELMSDPPEKMHLVGFNWTDPHSKNVSETLKEMR
jgi:hypothetical protein